METVTPPTPGRPRDDRIDAAVVAATSELLAERGYHGLSLAAVAARAGTTTQAIYRRWSSKQDLLLDVVFDTSGDEVVADTGDIHADVASMVRWTMQRLGSPAGRAALAGMLGEAPTAAGNASSRLMELWDRHRNNLDGLRSTGRVRPDVDVTEFIALVAGPAMLMGAVLGSADDDDTVDRLSRLVIEGIGDVGRPVAEVRR